jgi:hypothetical protein
MLVDEQQEKAPDKLDHQMSQVRVLTEDIGYLMTRARDGTLASIQEHIEVQEEIHDLQRILADWESYLSSEIAKKAAEYAIHGLATKIRMQAGKER